MTVKIELPSDVEANLAALALAQGMELPQFVESVLRERAMPPRSTTTLTPAEKAAAWRKGAKMFPVTPLLSDEAISRERMYNTRG